MQSPSNPEPAVYRCVRAVGTLKPRFQQNVRGPVFADALDVRGTAFFVGDGRHLITCAHVVQDLLAAPIELAGLLVVGHRGNYVRATIGVLDYMHDLAVLHLDPAQIPKEAPQPESLPLASAYPPVGTALAYAGFPLGSQLLDSTHAPTFAEGVVGAQVRTEAYRKAVQITGAVAGGFSGAPVVLRAEPNAVVGVLSHSPSAEAGQANIFMAVSWEHIRGVLALAAS